MNKKLFFFLLKLFCLLSHSIKSTSCVPIPQYENVDYVEEIEEEEPEHEEAVQIIPEISPPGAPTHGTGPANHTGPAAPASEKNLFKIPENYSVHKPPPLINGTMSVPVSFSILVFNVFDIKEIAEEISLEVNYKLQWRDTRLMNWTAHIEPGMKFTSLSPTLLHRLWHPDIFIDHIKRVTQPVLVSSASSLRLYTDGSLRYTARMLLVLTCRMNFRYYPADTQECNFTMKSFAFSDAQIDLGWKDGIGALLAKSIDVHNFDVALTTYPDYIQQTKSNNYTALIFGIRLRRKLSYHIIQTYVPSTLFTIVSWLSFLVPPDSTPGRMAICVTTLLTVTAMFGSVKQNTPNVSYIKALDIWMFMCIVFIFMSLAEFTLVLKLRSKKEKPKQSNSKSKEERELAKEAAAKKAAEAAAAKNAIKANDDAANKPKPAEVEPAKNIIALPVNSTTKFVNSVSISPPEQPKPTETPVAVPPPALAPPAAPAPPKLTRYAMTAARIEKYAPRFLPFIFVSFCGIYWPYLLIASEYYELNINPDMYYSV